MIPSLRNVEKHQVNLLRWRNLVLMRGMSSLLTICRPFHVLGSGGNSNHETSLQRIFLANYQASFLFHTSGMEQVNKKAEYMEKSREKSAELLESLRKKRLEGLVNPKPLLSHEERILKRIENIESIKKLVIFYWVEVKRKRELTPLHKFTILECIVNYFNKSVQMRDVFLVQEMQQNLFQMLVQDIRANLNAYDANQLCTIAICMAKLCVKDPMVYKDLERGILYYKLGGYSTKQLSELSWAFAKYRTRTNVDEIFHALDREIFARQLSDFTSEEMCLIVWAFAEYGVPDTGQFYKAIGNEILTRDLDQFQPWMVASFAFAYSNVESLNAEVFKVVEEQLFQREDLTPFATNDLVMLVLAFSRVGKLHPELFNMLETVMVRRRDFKEMVVEEFLLEIYDRLKNSEFHLAVLVKITERVLNPEVCNSLFDILFRPRRSWKEKVLHQYLFKAY
ncbi:uncharacterized protein LOC144662243 [Oculina patagonica]